MTNFLFDYSLKLLYVKMSYVIVNLYTGRIKVKNSFKKTL